MYIIVRSQVARRCRLPQMQRMASLGSMEAHVSSGVGSWEIIRPRLFPHRADYLGLDGAVCRAVAIWLR